MQNKFASLKLAVNHNKLTLVKDAMATAGTIHGLVVNFDFRTPEWPELTKVATFTRDGIPYLIPLDAVDECFIPWECLVDEGNYTIGVFGVADGVRIPTNTLEFKANEGCVCEGQEPANPTPELYEQILNLCSESKIIAQSIRDDANAGKFNGVNGEPGKDGETPIRGEDYFTEDDKLEMESNIISKIGDRFIDSPKTAKTGDVLKVKTVDKNDKPVEWECVVETFGADEYKNFSIGNNISGSKGFKIIGVSAANSDQTGVYTLRTVDGLEVGMKYSVQLSGANINAGEIISIDYDNNSITVDGYEYMDLQSVSDTNGYVYNYLTITGRPELGDIQIAFNCFVSGDKNAVQGTCGVATGYGNIILGRYGSATGDGNISGYSADANGRETKALGDHSHTEGLFTEALGDRSHAEGRGSKAVGLVSHAEGQNTTASGQFSHSEGENTESGGYASHAEGRNNKTTGIASHIEGADNNTSGGYSHVEGKNNKVTSNYSHVEGHDNIISGDTGHAEGANNEVSGARAHVEGEGCKALGNYSHAEGKGTIARHHRTHAEGEATEAKGERSHVEGYGTISTAPASHVQGKWNIEDTSSKFAHIIGNGTSNTNRSNAHTIDWNGNAWFAGDVSITDENGNDISLRNKIQSLENNSNNSNSVQGDYIPTPTTAQVGDILKVKVIDENGKPVEWECANESGGSGGGSSTSDKWELVTSYTHSGNKVIQPTALDMSTGYFTCENHGLVTGDYVTAFYKVKNQDRCPIPFELVEKANYKNDRIYPTCNSVTVIDENTFMITGKSSYGTTNNSYVDVTKFSFETQNTDFTGFNNLDIDLNVYDVKIIAHDFGKRVTLATNNLSSGKYNRLAIDGGHEYGLAQGVPVTPLGGVESYGSLVLSLKNGVLYGDSRQYMKVIAINSSALTYPYPFVCWNYNCPVLVDGTTLTTLNRLTFNDYHSKATGKIKPKNGGWIQVWKRLRQYQ